MLALHAGTRRRDATQLIDPTTNAGTAIGAPDIPIFGEGAKAKAKGNSESALKPASAVDRKAKMVWLDNYKRRSTSLACEITNIHLEKR
jgi:hypothetical protein